MERYDGGLSDSGCSEKAISLFEQMCYQGIDMDAVTYLGAIKACARLGYLAEGRWIHHKLITSGLKKDSCVDMQLSPMCVQSVET